MARPLHKFKFFCYDCKQHYEYREVSKVDAVKRFEACGHSKLKVKTLGKDFDKLRPMPRKKREPRRAP